MNVTPLRAVRASEIDEFADAGVVMLPGLIDQEWVEKLRVVVDRDIARTAVVEPERIVGGPAAPQSFSNMLLWTRDEMAARWAKDSPLPGLAAALLRSERVNLLFDQVFVKEPGATASKTPWHNDQPYWPVQGQQVCSFWLALDPVTRASGAVQYVRGSHRWERSFQPVPFRPGVERPGAEDPQFEPVPDIEAHRDEYDIVSWDMSPGDLLVHHGLALHGAYGNSTTDLRRRGYAVRYTGDDVTYLPHPAAAPQLLVDGLGAGDALPPPTFPLVWDDRASSTVGSG